MASLNGEASAHAQKINQNSSGLRDLTTSQTSILNETRGLALSLYERIMGPQLSANASEKSTEAVGPIDDSVFAVVENNTYVITDLLYLLRAMGNRLGAQAHNRSLTGSGAEKGQSYGG